MVKSKYFVHLIVIVRDHEILARTPGIFLIGKQEILQCLMKKLEIYQELKREYCKNVGMGKVGMVP